MLEPAPSGQPTHAVLVLSVLVIPLGATFLMEIAEAIPESLGWRVRLCRTGWDLCVLAVGSTGGIFTLPGVLNGWGAELAVIYGIGSLIIAVMCGLCNIHIRKTKPDDLTGMQAYLSIGLGVAALVLPWYFVVGSK